ncbi:hypothetical protein RhiirA4_452260 [Rhizophagus irregularis]|uniref:Uncharacterized protein n=1 Tax=Rhizophagus irregularis TaxID=588596 RepID=A0A2I1FXM6_9GLOM|nr:hypothetical protein RhiirA4_452260 [Rhizophagus irregularis]
MTLNRRTHPRFQAGNFTKNPELADKFCYNIATMLFLIHHCWYEACKPCEGFARCDEYEDSNSRTNKRILFLSILCSRFFLYEIGIFDKSFRFTPYNITGLLLQIG